MIGKPGVILAGALILSAPPIAFGGTSASGGAPPAGRMIDLAVGSEKIHGYLALPKGQGPNPAMVVIHEWWGLNDQIKGVADRLASHGYVALAPDLYRGKVTDKPEMANELLRALPDARATGDVGAAFAYLRALPAVGSKPIGSIGFCMGGGLSLRLALSEPRLAACVVCYGRPETDAEKLKAIAAPVLGIYGGQDKGIPADMLELFKKGMEKAGRSLDLHVYPEAGHGFMNAGIPSHRPDDTKASWELIDAFLAKILIVKP